MAPRDRRLLERDLTKGLAREEDLRAEFAGLPDLSDNAEFPSDESVEPLSAELEAEKVVRDLRIEKSIAEPRLPEVRIAPPAVPFDLE
jgi:hypothetical protein